MDYPDGAENKNFTLKEIDIKDNNKKNIKGLWINTQPVFLSFGLYKSLCGSQAMLIKAHNKRIYKVNEPSDISSSYISGQT